MNYKNEFDKVTADRDFLQDVLDSLAPLLCDLAQLCDGWHADGTAWSEWDESVRGRLSEALIKVNALSKRAPKKKLVKSLGQMLDLNTSRWENPEKRM